MNLRTLKIIRIILLVLACIAFFVGIGLSQKAEKARKTDLSKINVKIVGKECYYNQFEAPYTNGYYHILLTYELTNKTKVDWKYLSVETIVYDKNGKTIGSLTAEFGNSYGASNLKLKVGEKATRDSELKDNMPSTFFMTLYDSDLSDLTFESEITYGTYYESK
ncbi:MAG: hypothetical protein IKG97_01510 [Lachnospiraceae bacterium]|nr:hypothetical protein [Lachnospiraceae bacterium]